MNEADLAILAVLLISCAIGFFRGLVVEVMSIAVWVAAVALAMTFGEPVSRLFAATIDLVSLRLALAYLMVFVAVLVAGAILAFFIKKLLKGSGLSGTDRMLGLGFGLIRGGIVITVLVFIVGLTPFAKDAWWRESKALPRFQAMADGLVGLLPTSVRGYLDRVPLAAPIAAAERK